MVLVKHNYTEDSVKWKNPVLSQPFHCLILSQRQHIYHEGKQINICGYRWVGYYHKEMSQWTWRGNEPILNPDSGI